jgi:hypothetical protein
VVDARPTDTDLARTHRSYDMNTFVRPDPPDAGLVGTANAGGNVEVEWEQDAFPLFAWPTAGDRIDVLGAWVWDCGHFSPLGLNDQQHIQPGTQLGELITGEKTEIHPPRMVVVQRAYSSTSQWGEAETDVVISSDGTGAHAEAEQAAGRAPAPPARPDPAGSNAADSNAADSNAADSNAADSNPVGSWQPVNDRDDTFHVPAPPRPPGASTIRWRMEDRGSILSPPTAVTVVDNGLDVTVKFKDHRSPGERTRFAAAFFVGWDVGVPVRHLRVTVERARWTAELDSLDEPRISPLLRYAPPDEANLYIDVAGQWRELVAPGLRAIKPGDVVDLPATFDLWLAPSAPWRVYARGRECDMEGFAGCPAPNELGFNDDAGSFTARSPAAGPHQGTAKAFALDYRVEDLGSANAGPAPASTTGDRGTQPAARPGGRALLLAVLAALAGVLLVAVLVVGSRGRHPDREGA